ncbi:MAG: DUF2284 domain-containing protein [Candidatus Accumulibacter sp.]|jgi:predicted metal-binding protein|nr:DUF2284 domain-containing protein [Accumulibacter sp.]
MQTAHKHLLSATYDWAGLIRAYTTGRGDASGLARPGHRLDMTRIEANKGVWYETMKEGFERGDTSRLKREILERTREKMKPMYSVDHSTATIALADYVRYFRDAERFMGYCKACGRYDACWSCPPFEFDTEDYISPFETAHIIGTKVVFDEDTIERNRGLDKCKKTVVAMMEDVRRGLDGKLLELEKRYPASRAFFAGTCHVCPRGGCARIEKKPCIAPEKTRPSLESFGFDIGKTSSELLRIELKWTRDGVLPEYLTLVSGFFTREAIPEFPLFWR